MIKTNFPGLKKVRCGRISDLIYPKKVTKIGNNKPTNLLEKRPTSLKKEK